MNPNDRQYNPHADAQQVRPPARTLTPPPRVQPASTQAAAQVIRGQIDAIYSGDEQTSHTTPTTTQPTPATVQPAPQIASEPAEHAFQATPAHSAAANPAPQTTQTTSPYQRTMAQEPITQSPSKEQWQQYHSAWQKYYQMYYERQYLAHSYAVQQHLSKNTSNTRTVSESPIASSAQEAPLDGSLNQQQALRELRDSIRQKVTDSAQKVRKSRHFMPALAGLAVLFVVLGIQFNRPIVGALAAYTSPGNIDPQHIIADPTVEVEVGSEPRMIIPKINVDAPVVYGIGPDYKSQMTAMEKGIAHFSIPGANAVPGQAGNAVFAAHSSNDAFARGDYKFVFAQNEKLTQGDIIYMNFEGKRYTYSVTRTEVVLPTEVSRVQLDTNVPTLTLVSCVPLGTAEKRLLIFAEQISPSPTDATPNNNETETAPTASDIPGKPSPTLFERLFGAR